MTSTFRCAHSALRTWPSRVHQCVSDWLTLHAKNGLGGVLRRKGSKSGSNPSWNKGCLLLLWLRQRWTSYWSWNYRSWEREIDITSGDWRKEGAKWKRQLNSWSLPPLRHQFSTVFVFAFPFPLVLSHTCQSIVHTPQQFLRCTAAGFLFIFFSSSDLLFMPLLPNNTHCQIFKFKLNFITQTDRSKHNISLSFVPFPCSCSVVSQREKEKSETLTVTASQKSIRFQQQQQQQLTMCFSVCVFVCVQQQLLHFRRKIVWRGREIDWLTH